jgi:hypothetical protein
MKNKLNKNFGKEKVEDFVIIRRDWFYSLNNLVKKYKRSKGVKKQVALISIIGYISSAETIIKYL